MDRNWELTSGVPQPPRRAVREASIKLVDITGIRILTALSQIFR